MRRLNVFLVIGMFLSVFAHGIMASVQLAGGNADAQKTIAWIGVAFICAHVIVTTILTIRTLKTMKASGTSYFKENKMFWTARISGFAILIPLLMHLLIFHSANEGPYRLQAFTTGKLISQILLVACIAVHVLSNIRPLLIGFGVKQRKAFSADLLFLFSLLLLLFALAFVVYYLRWMRV